MNLSTCCNLNPLPPSSTPHPSSSSSSLLTRTNSSRKPNEDSSSWRSKKMMVIATTLVLTLEVGDIISNNINGRYYYTRANEIAMGFEVPKNHKMEKKVARWSDERSCPPWNMNSLETIVPENLPRPYFHRKWENISKSSKLMSPNKKAPSIEFLIIKPRKGCFSL